MDMLSELADAAKADDAHLSYADVTWPARRDADLTAARLWTQKAKQAAADAASASKRAGGESTDVADPLYYIADACKAVYAAADAIRAVRDDAEFTASLADDLHSGVYVKNPYDATLALKQRAASAGAYLRDAIRAAEAASKAADLLRGADRAAWAISWAAGAVASAKAADDHYQQMRAEPDEIMSGDVGRVAKLAGAAMDKAHRAGRDAALAADARRGDRDE